MRRRSILKWIVLTALSLTVVFVLSTIVHDETAAAAAAQTAEVTEGALQYIDSDGKPAECPLKHTEVKAEVSGFLSRVTVTQDFENTIENKIEAIYKFPLAQAAAVDNLTMLIGDRTVTGKIMRREEAKKAYDEAKQVGKVASLLNQERPNIFTQQVANIMPGQRIRIIISYVETLKYEDGSYEWSFPMVVAKRYTPAADPRQGAPAADADQNVYPINPTYARPGTRAGHDISLEIDLDAGVPIVGVNSESHETEVQQINEKRAVVRLKDRATIPNKDFLLKYRVAAGTINDAVLTHRSARGGFFTLILQPPQRVAAEDVMPKELIFVLDTSRSMEGFPIRKAIETMDLALNNLYPHDTFNLITFAGETSILFEQPVLATPENLRRAKKFLASRKSDGGTEMMNAIKAALQPSESQDYVRIVCFMTDGQVGNDFEILAEVQKHPNARVFAMGFSNSPNRYLLDKMAEYGLGEVDYISEAGDTSAVARRFNERVRNPLLTDISIDWSNLRVAEVYPKRIPDLFDVKPVILSGRYNGGGKGTIRLNGKMAGQDFVRDIPVELPEAEADHDVLATLWGRRKIEDLMSDEVAGIGDQTVRTKKREEIVQVGLNFRLMTQYTSFIAIDDVVFTGPEEPKRVEIPVETGAVSTSVSANYVTVVCSSSADVSCTVNARNYISERSLQDLPIQGRSFSSLVTLTPGANAAGTNTTNMSVNGQPASSNEFKLDGVSANFGIAAGGASASGNLPAWTASGGANGIATLGAIQEVKIQSFAVQAEYGRGAGAHVEVATRSGTNAFHGSVFHFFGNDALDANDWFANSRSLKQPPKRLNSFGGTLGGPIRKDHTFFFASYEGTRLRQPVVGITDVPSLHSRAAAPLAMQPFLDVFPIPNGA
ncbi:MAG TPA: VIT and VWA domain-containing protein, partial [Pyrinomonadaceae bacterium]